MLVLTLAAGYAVYATQKELTRRARENERVARTAGDQKAKDLEESAQKLEETGTRLAEAQKVAEEARALVKRMEDKQSQRVITPAQKAAFIAATARTPKGSIAVEILMGGPECHEYANQIRDMVVAAGFDSGSEVQQGLSGLPAAKGVIVWARDATKLPPFTSEVLNALVAIGLEIQTHSDPNNRRIPNNGLLITVEPKP